MNNKLLEIIKKGEGIETEFKESYTKINNDVYQTVCAFLNRFGGHIFLGINNTNKLSPTFYLSIEEYEIEEKKIIYINIPESSQVHRCN